MAIDNDSNGEDVYDFLLVIINS